VFVNPVQSCLCAVLIQRGIARGGRSRGQFIPGTSAVHYVHWLSRLRIFVQAIVHGSCKFELLRDDIIVLFLRCWSWASHWTCLALFTVCLKNDCDAWEERLDVNWSSSCLSSRYSAHIRYQGNEFLNFKGVIRWFLAGIEMLRTHLLYRLQSSLHV